VFAQELKRWRQRRFLTQKGLADVLGSSLSTVQKWEMGHTLPYPSARRQLIEVLEVEPDELFAAIEASQAVMEQTKKAAA
jgi:DNA-binding transcriptional regulator YiaG